MWNHGDCAVCDLYEKGYCKGYPSSRKDPVAATFKALKTESSPICVERGTGLYRGVNLLLVDMEKRTSRFCTVDDAKNWNWTSEVQRTIDNWHIHSYARLLEVLTEKAEKGIKTVEIRETPKFMMISTGY